MSICTPDIENIKANDKTSKIDLESPDYRKKKKKKKNPKWWYYT